ncbi:MAG: glycosyltransferase family 9 protein, partial [Parachlamydiales bacterium]
MNRNLYSINNNKLLSLLLYLFDFFSVFFVKKSKNSQKSIQSPKKILVSNIAHLGDVILSLGILPVLKKEFPDAKIYFLCGSWSNEIVQAHPLIDGFCNFDHYKLNRSNVFFIKKIIKHFRTRREAIKFIKNENISLAVDLRLHFPNSIPLLYKGRIETRLGYTCAGFGCFLTHWLDYEKKDVHITKYYIDLIDPFLKNKILDKQLLPKLHVENVIISKEIITKLPDNYYVIHIGSGDKLKMIDIQYWIEIKNRLVLNKIPIVFTGNGEFENEMINQIINGSDFCINLCGGLNLNDLFFVVKNSKKIISVDTL